MITDGKKMTLSFCKKILSALLNGITSKHNRDFHCLNCFYSFRTENALKNMKMHVRIITIVMLKHLINTIIY